MSIEIGSLVVKGAFGRPAAPEPALDEAELAGRLADLRRELRDEIARATEDLERRLREGHR